MLVLGVDGGVHTGVALIDTDKVLVEGCYQSWLFEGRGWRGEYKMAEHVVNLADDLDVHVLCVEDFLLWNPQSADRDGLSSPRVVAMVDALMVERMGVANYGDNVAKFGLGQAEYVFRRARQASDAKTTWTNARIRAKGLDLSGKSDHEIDALRHVLLFGKQADLLVK